jgi:hypothetical protein
MQALVDRHCPKADVIRVVLDNLSTHSVAALYQTFDPGEARRIARKLEFYYVPKHASWLNMVEIEIEIGILKQRCLSRGIADRETLVRDVAAWEKCRNESPAQIQWMFTLDKAREKLGRVYRPLSRHVTRQQKMLPEPFKFAETRY